MSYYAFHDLISRIRKYIGLFEGRYNQAELRDHLETLGKSIGKNTYSKMEQDPFKPKKGQEDEKKHVFDDLTFENLAYGLSHKLHELRTGHDGSELFDHLSLPEIGWLIDRLNKRLDPLLTKEHLMLNHESRYLVDEYDIKLIVCPSHGQSVEVKRYGLPTEQFKYANIAKVKYKLKFHEENNKLEPGFELGYTTHEGRLELLKPGVEKLASNAYRIQRNTACYLPDPRSKENNHLHMLVYGGYGIKEEQDHQLAHFKMAQPAVYKNVSFSLDLASYPREAFIKFPELVMVPYLTDREYECCNIARSGQGLKIDPDKDLGLTMKWHFKDLANVMICIHWQIDHDRVPPENQINRETLIRY